MAHSQRLQPRARVTSGWSFAAAVGLSALLVTTPNPVQAPIVSALAGFLVVCCFVAEQRHRQAPQSESA